MKKTILYLRITLIFIALFIAMFGKSQTFNCGDNFIDNRDGKSYKTVAIGKQCWMAENLNIGNKIKGTIEQTDNSIIEKYCYNDSIKNCDIYGGLYQWYEATEKTQGICPMGWHIPSHNEWTTLERAVCSGSTCETDFPYDETTRDYQGSDEANKLKEAGKIHWSSSYSGVTNSSGFTALPGGDRGSNSLFANIRVRGYWWTSTIYLPFSSNSWLRGLSDMSGEVLRNDENKFFGFSLHCIADKETTFIDKKDKLNNNININPNPANERTVVNYQLSENNRVKIILYDITGREVKEVINENQTKGEHKIIINSQQLEDGIYILKLNTNNHSFNRKIIVKH